MTIPSLDWLDEEIADLEESSSLANLIKASFGGDRSEAGRYAANIRWQGNRKGNEGGSPPPNSLKEQIDETAQSLAGLGKLPIDNRVDNYESSYSLYTTVRLKNGKTESVLGPVAMRVEAEVNALGKRVLGEAGARVVKSGFCTQQELDDAIAHQSRPPDDEIEDKSYTDRAVDGDPKVYPLVKDLVDEYVRLKTEAKVARGILIKATKEYNKIREAKGFGTETREAFQVRVEMQRNNRMAKRDMERALQVLEGGLSDLRWEEGSPINILDNEKETKRFASWDNKERYLAIHIQVGQEVKKIIGEYRPMAEKYPVSVPTTEKREKLVQEVASRFPQSLLGKIPSDITIQIKPIGGGSWSERTKTIKTDLDDPDTFTHETVHALTFYSRAMRLMENAALTRRTWGKKGDLTTPIEEKIKQGRQRVVSPTAAGLQYKRGKYIVDDFVDPYQGRIYTDSYTETLTVATENLFGGGRNLRMSGRADRDLMATALGALLTAEKTDD